MTLFMIFFVFIVALYCMLTKDYFNNAKNKTTSILIGFALGIVMCLLILFFTTSYYLSAYSFVTNFISFYFYDVVFPYALCAIFTYLLIKPYSGKWFELSFFVIGFMAIYMPTRALSMHAVFDWYLLFIRPIMFVVMVFGIHNIYSYMLSSVNYNRSETKKITFDKKILLTITFIFLFSIIPSITDVLHVLDINTFILLGVFILYVLTGFYSTRIARLKI